MLPIPIQQLIPKNGRSCFVSKVLGQPLTGISRWQVARQRTGKCIRAQCARAQCTARLLNGRGTLNRSRAVKLKKGRNCIAEDRIFPPFQERTYACPARGTMPSNKVASSGRVVTATATSVASSMQTRSRISSAA